VAALVLGPIQRGLATDGVRIWVETDVPCVVEVAGHRSDTWTVAGHHYALVDLSDLTAGADLTYDVRLDGEVVWPEPGDARPAPRLRTWSGDGPVRLVLGSCRQAAPPSRRHQVESEADPPGIGTDALEAFARSLAAGDEDEVHGLVLLGDQVYADEPDPQTVDAIRARRGGPPRAGWPEVSSFEEYTWLYHEAWSYPWIRWLMATVPSVMVFDDHDIIDDWNTSEAWRREMEAEPWWTSRLRGGLMAYWVYQHIGNVGGDETEDAALLSEIRDAGPCGEAPLGAFAVRADAGTADDIGHRWSFCRRLGGSRLVVVDSRNGRILEEGKRSMLGAAEWSWLGEQMTGDVDHLFLASSVPWLLPPAIHDLESWSDALTEGAWGGRAGRFAEWLRQYVDLEHWAAFGRSFDALAGLVAAASRGERGEPPETITVLSGDVHFGYVAEADLDGRSRVLQLVSSPLRQAITTFDRWAQGAAMLPPASWICRALVRTTPKARPRFRWQVTDGLWFDDHLVVLTVDGRSARATYRRAGLDGAGRAVLTEMASRSL
jgi:hypothetical protein